MNAHTPSSSSFFDYQNDPTGFNFVKLELHHRHYLALQPTTKTQNTRCLNLNTGTFLEGTFKLHGNLLAYYYDPSENSPRRVLDLQYARIKAYEANMSSSRYALRITKYNTSFELYFNNENILDYWVECLLSIGVFPSVEAIYTPLVFFKENFLSSTQNKRTAEFFALKKFSKDKFHQPHLKVIGSFLASSHSKFYKTLLLNQITMMRSFNHPNIVGLHQVFETYTTIYFAKPYNPSETLGAFLRRSDPNVELQTPRIINSILQGLSYLASEGIFLQNLNINSVILTKEGNIKIIDFLYLTRSNMEDLAQQKALCPGYIAPEVLKYDKRIQGTTFNETSNVFSVGCILFEMLFGIPLFNENDPVNILRLNKSFNFSTVSQIIKEEIQNPQSSINKQGLDLLLLLLEPDFNKRISAREAQNHPYFQIEDHLQYQVNIPLEKVQSNSSKKSDPEQYSPSISCSQASSNNGSPTSAGTKLYPSVSSNVLSIPTSFVMTRRRNYTDFDKHSQSALLKETEETVPRRKSVSFVDQLYERTYSNSPLDLKETEEEEDDDDTGDLSESEAELESCNIEAFFDSHRIKISLKNPGKK